MNTPKYRCLVVDDEPIARQILLGYIALMPNLECAGECKNAFEAIEQIQLDSSIEILFLDINMPNLDGLTMVRALPRRMQVVFTTAYSKFAVESYELSAVDYLLKPFLFERFAQAVFKATERLAPLVQEKVLPPESPVIFVKSGGEIHRLPLSEIVFCEAMKNYTKIVLRSGQTLCPLMPISRFEEVLARSAAPGAFLRVHRSFLVALEHAGPLGTGYLMMEGAHKVPVGPQFRELVLTSLGLK